MQKYICLTLIIAICHDNLHNEDLFCLEQATEKNPSFAPDINYIKFENNAI